MVQYETWHATGDQFLLEEIREYNKEDCENTKGLRDWLLSIRLRASDWLEEEPFDKDKKTGKQDDALLVLLNRLRESAPSGTEETRELAGQLTRFHSRASKPQWWEFFQRAEMTEEELLQSANCLGGLEVVDTVEPPDKRGSPRYWCTYPNQEHKFRSGADCVFSGVSTDEIGPLDVCGKIEDIDYEKGRVLIARSRDLPELPERFSVIPAPPIPTFMLSLAVEKYCESLIVDSNDYEALSGFLRKETPVIRGCTVGKPLIDPEHFDDAVIGAVANLSESYLAIQGPPGTGKTTLGSKIIVEFMRRGHKIGVSSNSHKAIHELLEGVESQAELTGLNFQGMKKASRGFPDSFFDGKFIDNTTSVRGIRSRILQPRRRNGFLVLQRTHGRYP